MKTNLKVNLEPILIAAALVAAIGMRFYQLGVAPMGDSEAQQALTAFNLSDGQPALYQVGQALYLVLTTGLFSIFTATNSLARLIPALAGSLLVLTPLLFKDRIGRTPMLILIFLLAFDPALVSAARTAGGASLAMLLFICCGAAWLRKKYSLAGVLFGAALLSGKFFWFGLVVAAITFGFSRWLAKSGEDAADSMVRPQRADVIKALIWLAGSLLTFGGLFLLVPAGFSALGTGMVEFWKGWGTPSGVSALFPLFAIVCYQLLGLIFGIAQTATAFTHTDRFERLASIFWLTALLVLTVYPGREMALAGWVSMPLLFLTARRLAALFFDEVKWSMPSIGLAVGIFLLTISFWLTVLLLNNYAWPNPFDVNNLTTPRWIWLPIAFALMIAAIYNVHLAWPGTARLGAAAGWTAALTLFGLSASFSAAGLAAYPEAQLWRPDPWLAEEDLFQQTLEEYSAWVTGNTQAVDIVVQNMDMPSMRWALHDFKNVIYTDTLPTGSTPTILVTPNQPTLALAAEYRGQDFIWNSSPMWSLLLPQEWFDWFVYKDAPLDESTVITWVRADLFPDRISVEE